MRAVLLLALMAVCGCAASTSGAFRYPPAYSFTLSADVDAETFASFLEAAREWSDATGVNIDVTQVPCTGPHCTGAWGNYDVTMATEADLAVAALAAGNPPEEFYGLTTANGIVILEGLDAFHDQVTVTHEMGHALGMHHVTDYAIMNPHFSTSSPVVTSFDVAQYAELRQ